MRVANISRRTATAGFGHLRAAASGVVSSGREPFKFVE